MNTLDRFQGNVAWSQLDDLQRVAIGSISLELLSTWWAQEQAADPHGGSDPLLRAADFADTMLMEMLRELMVEAIPREMLEIDGQPRLPSLIGPVCHECGCSQEDGCFPQCHWVAHDLCSACAPVDPINLQGSGPAPIEPREG